MFSIFKRATKNGPIGRNFFIFSWTSVPNRARKKKAQVATVRLTEAIRSSKVLWKLGPFSIFPISFSPTKHPPRFRWGDSLEMVCICLLYRGGAFNNPTLVLIKTKYFVKNNTSIPVGISVIGIATQFLFCWWYLSPSLFCLNLDSILRRTSIIPWLSEYNSPLSSSLPLTSLFVKFHWICSSPSLLFLCHQRNVLGWARGLGATQKTLTMLPIGPSLPRTSVSQCWTMLILKLLLITSPECLLSRFPTTISSRFPALEDTSKSPILKFTASTWTGAAAMEFALELIRVSVLVHGLDQPAMSGKKVEHFISVFYWRWVPFLTTVYLYSFRQLLFRRRECKSQWVWKMSRGPSGE